MITYVSQFCLYIVTAVVGLSLVWPVSLYAYFNDQIATQNLLAAGQVTFDVGLDASFGTVGYVYRSFDSQIGITHDLDNASSSLFFATSVIGDSAFCESLTIDVSDVGLAGPVTTATAGPVAATPGLQVAELIVMFNPNSGNPVDHGVGCDVTLDVQTIQTAVAPQLAGFYDKESLTWSFTSSAVVLNEVLPDPATGQQEFIELFNNGTTDVDVTGWTISELLNGNPVSHVIKSNSTSSADLVAYDNSGSTVVPAGGHLALKFAGSSSFLNNGGDTVTLRDTTNQVHDSYTYTTSIDGKSDARIPDGIGNWIDPIPTPGEPNKLSLNNLSVALVADAESAVLASIVAPAASSSASSTESAKKTSGGGSGSVAMAEAATSTASTTVATESEIASTTEALPESVASSSSVAAVDGGEASSTPPMVDVADEAASTTEKAPLPAVEAAENDSEPADKEVETEDAPVKEENAEPDVETEDSKDTDEEPAEPVAKEEETEEEAPEEPVKDPEPLPEAVNEETV